MIWLNGALVPPEHAMVPALDRGVLWGYGLFETMRAYGGRVWALDDHYARMRAGAETTDIEVPDEETLSGALDDVLHANDLREAGVRITVTRGSGPPDPGAEPDGDPNVIVTAWTIADYSALYEGGAALVTIAGGGRPLAGIKTTSYAVSVVGRALARRSGADDALFVGEAGRVLEATASNLFAVAGRRLATPPLEDPVLPGITRMHVMGIAPPCGLTVVERPLTLTDLFEADEVLATSSLREVYPVASIDGRAVGRGPWADRLRRAYREAVLASL